MSVIYPITRVAIEIELEQVRTSIAQVESWQGHTDQIDRLAIVLDGLGMAARQLEVMAKK